MMRATKGFTLVEILASTAIGSIVLLLAVASLSNTGDEYGRNTDGVAAEREARAILTQVAEDMSKALGNELMIEDSGGLWRQDKLGFACLQPRDAQAKDEAVGDLCLVSYYIKDLEIGQDTVRCLMRGFRGSNEAIEAFRSGQVEELYGERAEDEPVAFGVIAFEAEGLIRQENGGWESWKEGVADTPADKPDAVRLRLVVARRELASKLRSTADWDGSALIGEPSQAERSKLLEVYEITHSFGHAL